MRSQVLVMILGVISRISDSSLSRWCWPATPYHSWLRARPRIMSDSVQLPFSFISPSIMVTITLLLRRNE